MSLENQIANYYHNLSSRLNKRDNYLRGLNISLSWKGKSDLDLQVKCPCGLNIRYSLDECKRCGGKLDKDSNGSFHHHEQVDDPVENIYWEHPDLTANYVIEVFCYDNRTTDRSSIPFECIVTFGNCSRIFNYFDGISYGCIKVFEGNLDELFDTSCQYDLSEFNYDPSVPPAVSITNLP